MCVQSGCFIVCVIPLGSGQGGLQLGEGLGAGGLQLGGGQGAGGLQL